MAFLKKFLVTFSDYPLDASSWSITIFCNGCNNNCPNCHNASLRDFYQDESTFDITKKGLIDCEEALRAFKKKANTNKVVVLGGEPLYSENREFLFLLMARLSDEFEFVIYTGYTAEKVIDDLPSLPNLKAVKFGPYINRLRKPPKKTSAGIQLASSNQEIYSMFPTRKLLSTQGFYAFTKEH